MGWTWNKPRTMGVKRQGIGLFSHAVRVTVAERADQQPVPRGGKPSMMKKIFGKGGNHTWPLD